MTELVPLAVIVVVFIAGTIAGAILLVSLASLREDRRPLRRRPDDGIARAGRLVTGLRVEHIKPVPEARPRPRPGTRPRPGGDPRPPEPAAWSGGTTIGQRGIYN
jgi:hypothetical protein